MRYIYYPGCALKSTGRHYEESLRAVFDELGIDLEELKDWNCCGATAYMSIDELDAFALAARNLALAERWGGKEMIAPCSACYLVLNKTRDYMERYPQQIGTKVKKALKAAGLDYKNSVKVRHPLDILVNDFGIEEIKKRSRRSLNGLKIAPYYGCQIVRPYATFDDPFYPVTMDRLFSALGAEVVDYPLKTKCCGGSLTGTIEEVGLRLSYILLKNAKANGAELIVTVCPLCQFNLECYQDEVVKKYGEDVRMPILYFTQLLGIALGLSEDKLGIKRLLVSPKPLFARIGMGEGELKEARL